MSASLPFAFPVINPAGVGSWGLTKRELFAAMAMQGMLSISPPGMTYRADTDFQDDARWLARRACMSADALLAALEESK